MVVHRDFGASPNTAFQTANGKSLELRELPDALMGPTHVAVIKVKGHQRWGNVEGVGMLRRMLQQRQPQETILGPIW